MQLRLRLFLILSTFLGATLLALAIGEADAQPPGGKKGKGGGGPPESADSFIAKMMAFNKAKDGKLTKTELTDTRLLALFDRADANKDGVVTRDELQTLFNREQAEFGKGGFGDKGKGGKGGFGDKGKGFKGGPKPGQVLNPLMQDMLNLTDSQKKQLADLQKDVDAKLHSILTADQRQQLRDMSKGFGDKKGGPFGGKKGEPK